MLFDTGPEGAVFLRNCKNMGIKLGDIEHITMTHGHWDHMGALMDTVKAIKADNGDVTVHVNPDMFNPRAVTLPRGQIVPVQIVPGVYYPAYRLMIIVVALAVAAGFHGAALNRPPRTSLKALRQPVGVVAAGVWHPADELARAMAASAA
jgi:metal-dependent hydrolase (beta-lactamase superfamily II)